MSRPTRRVRDESGTVAILTAIMAVLLLSIAALGVDLGNAMNRKMETRTAADFSALAGANALPDTSSATLQIVADYLNHNLPPSDGNDATCNSDPGPVTSADLVDGNAANGEVTFSNGNKRIKVLTPAVKVSFGFAVAMTDGPDSTCVQSSATARISTANTGMQPYYVTGPCSSGPQTLKDNSGGLSLPYTVPTLANDSDTNGSTLSAISPNSITLANLGDPAAPQITVSGTNLGAASVTKVGFFNSDQSEPVEVAQAQFLSQSAGSVSVEVPNAVAAYQDVWYVRVFAAGTNKWSTSAEAQPLQVGEAVLSCDASSSSGNFGSIDLPWGGNDDADLAMNIMLGQRPPTTIQQFPAPIPALENACNTDTRGVVSTDALSKENTNCVQTVTGLRSGPASEGLLDASGGVDDGRLNKDTSSVCQLQAGQPIRDHGTVSGKDLNVNADLLSCFLANDSLKISDTIHYNGSDSLYVQDIWKSPRFILVPTIDHDPNGTKWMPITGFVPGFITDQPTGASRISNIQGTTTDNGLVVTWSGNKPKLGAFRVIFFDIDALPPPPDGVKLQDYIGSGKKIVSLVD